MHPPRWKARGRATQGMSFSKIVLFFMYIQPSSAKSYRGCRTPVALDWNWSSATCSLTSSDIMGTCGPIIDMKCCVAKSQKLAKFSSVWWSFGVRLRFHWKPTDRNVPFVWESSIVIDLHWDTVTMIEEMLQFQRAKTVLTLHGMFLASRFMHLRRMGNFVKFVARFWFVLLR